MQLLHPTGYFPTWQELVISLTLIALGFIAAGIAVTFLPIAGRRGEDVSGEIAGAYRLAWRPPAAREGSSTEAGESS
jgi:hypothetical protein